MTACLHNKVPDLFLVTVNSLDNSHFSRRADFNSGSVEVSARGATEGVYVTV